MITAPDGEHAREVALQGLHAQWAPDESHRSRFRREAQIAARLDEPHVIPIHRYGEIDGQRGGGTDALSDLRSWWSDTADRGR